MGKIYIRDESGNTWEGKITSILPASSRKLRKL